MSRFSEEHIEEIKRQYSFLEHDKMKSREHGRRGYSARDDFHRDYTRILYSSSFRRLQGKMQILGVEPSAFFRNRLTHSLEVSQIAHSIAANICEQCNGEVYGKDLFLIDAAALAHDIGHPAFGHKGERVLNELAQKTQLRFEGNAQNFRVLRTLEKKEPNISGLNLTNRTLLAINKYIVSERTVPDAKKFMYANDFNYLFPIRKEVGLGKRRTLDVQIIELADDIAYSVHDLEDALAFRYFSIDELLYVIKKKDENAFNQLNSIVDNSREYARAADTYKTIQEYSQVFRKRLTSCLTDMLINDVTLAEVTDPHTIRIHGTEAGQMELQLGEYKNLCKQLSSTVFDCVTRDTNVTMYEKKGEIILRGLYDVLSDETIDANGKLLPPDYRPKEGYSLQQGCIDYLAGMMDTFAIAQYREYYGVDFDDIKLGELICKPTTSCSC